jgi:hypothetical protein
MGNQLTSSDNKLYVKIIEAQGLKRGDLISSDPFCKVKLKGAHMTHKTQVIKVRDILKSVRLTID